jgi:hypothetical protein
MSDLEGSNDVDPLGGNLTRDTIYFPGKYILDGFVINHRGPRFRGLLLQNNVSRLSARPRVLCLLRSAPQSCSRAISMLAASSSARQ